MPQSFVCLHYHFIFATKRREPVLSDSMRPRLFEYVGGMLRQYPELSQFAWQTGYGAFAVSYSSLEAVEIYIRGQAEHHRTISFREEFLAFLKRHDLAYDPKYLWD